MIKIKKSQCADTRTCDWTNVSKDELLKNSRQHIRDVGEGINYLIELMEDAAYSHDHTKIVNIDEFHNDFKTGFTTTDWWQMHQQKERHHLKDPAYVQDDVNLIDILEMIVDGVMAGLARTGKYRKEDIPDSLLRKAFDNTIDQLLKEVEVEKEELNGTI